MKKTSRVLKFTFSRVIKKTSIKKKENFDFHEIWTRHVMTAGINSRNVIHRLENFFTSGLLTLAYLAASQCGLSRVCWQMNGEVDYRLQSNIQNCTFALTPKTLCKIMHLFFKTKIMQSSWQKKTLVNGSYLNGMHFYYKAIYVNTVLMRIRYVLYEHRKFFFFPSVNQTFMRSE